MLLPDDYSVYISIGFITNLPCASLAGVYYQDSRDWSRSTDVIHAECLTQSGDWYLKGSCHIWRKANAWQTAKAEFYCWLLIPFYSLTVIPCLSFPETHLIPTWRVQSSDLFSPQSSWLWFFVVCRRHQGHSKINTFLFFFSSHAFLRLIRAVFNWVSKIIWNCFGFALLRSVIGLKISRHLLNQSDAKPKPIDLVTRALPRLAPVTCIYFELWLVHCVVYVCCLAIVILVNSFETPLYSQNQSWCS